MLCNYLGIEMCNTLLNTVLYPFLYWITGFFCINILILANRVMMVKASSKVTHSGHDGPKHSWDNYRATGQNNKSKVYKQMGVIAIMNEEFLTEIIPKSIERRGL